MRPVEHSVEKRASGNRREMPSASELVPLARQLAGNGRQNGRRAAKRSVRDNRGPDYRGHGSHFDKMAEREGFEPSNTSWMTGR